MATLTISGGVRENALTGAAAGANFTTITLQNTDADPRTKTFPQGIIGLPDALQPVRFTFRRRIRKLFVDDLTPICVYQFARPPLLTRGGLVADAVAQNSSAELVKFTYTVMDGRDGTSYSESFWGVFQLENVQRDGNSESGTILAFPCNVLRFANSTSYYADPDTTF
jgi:hypothetical protein